MISHLTTARDCGSGLVGSKMASHNS